MVKVNLNIVAAILLVVTGGALVWAAHGIGAPRVASLAPPTETTPEIIATRGCIEGLAHPTDEQLGFHDQLAACDALDDMGLLSVLVRRYRADLLLNEGVTEAHAVRALEDLDALIRENPTAWVYFSRARILGSRFDQLEFALDDINAAMALREDPVPGDLAIRAVLLISMDHRDQTTDRMADALRDVDTLETLDPDNQNIARIRAWIEQHLRAMAVQDGAEVVPG